MLRSKLKLSVCLLTIFLVLTTVCFATGSDTAVLTSEPLDTNIISESGNSSSTDNNDSANIKYSDLYVSDKHASINNTIIGNTYASVDTLNINSSSNGNSANSILSGNLFATAKTVNIKSDVTYSSEIDKDGNAKIENVNSASVIGGNAFITANKLTIEPGVEINGDLFVCANEIVLSKNAIIYGNIYAVANKIDLNCQVAGDLYVNCKEFNMNYYGFVYRDLHINAKVATIGGYAYRNSFINANEIITTSNFINAKDFTIENSEKFTFSGEIKGNANVKAKEIELKNKENEENITCKIFGDFNYNSKNEITSTEGIVNGASNFTKYSYNHFKNIGSFLLNLLSIIIYVLVVYLIVKKIMPNFFDKLSNISPKNMLINLAIGLGILILIPIACMLLFITGIGAILGVVLALLYVVLLLVATPLFTILITEYVKKLGKLSINSFVLLVIITIILQLLFKIPFIGSLLSFLATLAAIGSVPIFTLRKK